MPTTSPVHLSPILRTRIAPTPSGFLHLGNVLSFAITWALARQRQGSLVLRIDDLDNARFRAEYLHDIFDTLDFLGLDYDEGPRSPGDFLNNHSQMNRLARYERLLEQLRNLGLVYACPCSRSQINALSREGKYQGTCRNRQVPLDTQEVAWRVLVPDQTVIGLHDLWLGDCAVELGAALPDFVVRRKEGLPAYQIASLADDLAMEINLVVRGSDLLPSTAAQLYLADKLGATAFREISFVHHPLVQGPGGTKLSKSKGALSLREMRRTGSTPAALWNRLGQLMGWPAGKVSKAADFKDLLELPNLPRV